MTEATKYLRQAVRLHQDALSHPSAPKLPGWKLALERLSQELEAHADREERIERDRTLTPEGKRQALAKLARERNLSWVEQLVDDVSRALTRAKGVLFRPLPERKGDTVVTFLRQQEIRQNMAQVQPCEVDRNMQPPANGTILKPCAPWMRMHQADLGSPTGPVS